jgi:hypothetical protein
MDKSIKMSETSFRLNEHSAIELINSVYTYKQLKFFMDLLPALTIKNNIQSLDKAELQLLAQLVSILSSLIDSTELSYLLIKFSSQQTIKIPSKKRSFRKKIDIKRRGEILSNQMLQWISALPSETRGSMGSIPSMEEFFTSEIFLKEFIKWVRLLNLKTDTTLVEILDAYYCWFPVMPQRHYN